MDHLFPPQPELTHLHGRAHNLLHDLPQLTPGGDNKSIRVRIGGQIFCFAAAHVFYTAHLLKQEVRFFHHSV